MSISKHLLSLICLFSIFGFLHASEEQSLKALSSVAQELVNLRKNDPDISKRFSFKSLDVKYYLSVLDICDYVDTKISKLERISQHCFFKLLAPTNGLILLSQEKAPKLHTLVDDLCLKMKMSKPAIFVSSDSEFFNAFAYSVTQSLSIIAVGEKLVSALSEEELRGVLAHELAHVKHNHVTKRVAVLFGATTLCVSGYYLFIACILNDVLRINERLECEHTDQHNIVFSPTPKRYFLYASLGVLAGLGLLNIFPWLSRSQEEEADLMALEITDDPESMVGFFEAIKKEHEEQVKIYREEFAYLEEKLKDFSQRHQTIGNFLSGRANAYKTLLLGQLDPNAASTTHPALEARKAYIKELYAKTKNSSKKN